MESKAFDYKAALRDLIGELHVSPKASFLIARHKGRLEDVLRRHKEMEWEHTPMITRLMNLVSIRTRTGTVGSIQLLPDGTPIHVVSHPEGGITFVHHQHDVGSARLEHPIFVTELRDHLYRLLETYDPEQEIPAFRTLISYLTELNDGALHGAPAGRSEVEGQLAPPACPACSEVGTLRSLEAVEEERKVFGFDAQGVLRISESVTYWEGDGSRARLWCEECEKNFALPEVQWASRP